MCFSPHISTCRASGAPGLISIPSSFLSCPLWVKVSGNDLVSQVAAYVQAQDLFWCRVICFLNGENILVFSPGSCAAPHKNGVQIPRHQVKHSDVIWLWLQFDKGEHDTRWLAFILGKWISWPSMTRHIRTAVTHNMLGPCLALVAPSMLGWVPWFLLVRRMSWQECTLVAHVCMELGTSPC